MSDHLDMMDDWEKRLFGDQPRQWWAGAEVHKVRSCMDEPELPELKAGQKIFDLPRDPHLEISDPEAPRRLKGMVESFAKLYGPATLGDNGSPPLAENGSPPPDNNGLVVFGVDMARPHAVDVTAIGVGQPGQEFSVKYNTGVQTDESGGTVTVACDGRATCETLGNVVDGVVCDYAPYPGMPINWETIERAEALIDGLSPYRYGGVMSKLFDDEVGEVINYDLLDEKYAGERVRVQGVLAWAADLHKPVLAVRVVPTTFAGMDGRLCVFIDHIPTGCVLTFPPFQNVEMAARVAVEIGKAVGGSLNTKNVRQAMAGLMPVATYLADMLSLGRGFTEFDEW